MGEMASINRIGIFKGATSSTDGSTGVVPMPAAGSEEAFLRGDSTWASPSTEGFVLGPPSSVNKSIATFSGTAGDVIQDTGVVIDISNNISTPGTVGGSNLSGTNTGDQTISLTGDITGSGTGTFATTIAVSAVTNNKIATGAVTSAKIGASAVDLTTKVNGFLPIGNIVSTAGSPTTQFLRGDGVWDSPSTEGFVSGPSSSTNNTIPVFNGTSGNIIKDTGVSIDISNNIATTGTINSGSITSSGTINSGAITATGNITATGDITATGNVNGTNISNFVSGPSYSTNSGSIAVFGDNRHVSANNSLANPISIDITGKVFNLGTLEFLNGVTNKTYQLYGPSLPLISGYSAYLPISSGGTLLVSDGNLSGLDNYSTARSNLGLGTLATQSTVSLASQVSGFLPIGNIISTAGSPTTQFLRGDGTWNVPVGKTFQVLQQQYTTGPHTYTPTAGMVYCIVECQGAGGGGAGIDPTNTTLIGAGGGGAGGAYIKDIFSAAQIGSSQSISIGTPGTGGIGSFNGIDGGNVSFGTGGVALTANGGQGGRTVSPGSGTTVSGIAIGGSATGQTTSFIILGDEGSKGISSIVTSTTFVIARGGEGGNAFLGQGGNGTFAFFNMSASGINANILGYGGGGSGAANGTSIGSPGTGGNGGAGIVIITEIIYN